MHRLYENGDISVFWDSDKCRHAKECVNGCPEAFNIMSIAFYSDKIIGECDYEENENGWVIYHTEVDEKYTGKGIAKRLVYKLIQEAERSNNAIDATCSYAAKILGE